MSFFPDLSAFEPTRKTLHAYAQAVGVVARAHARPHDKWWHISLRLTNSGLTTTKMDLPDGGVFWLEMNLVHHVVRLQTDYGGTRAFDITAGLTGTEFGETLLTAVADLGLSAAYDRSRFAGDEARAYDSKQAAAFFTALTHAHDVLADHRARLTGHMGPLQIWPHGFDLAFEWFGTRTVEYEEDGETQTVPAQINFGFYPGEEPYFYANPWPFDEALLDETLPGAARWHTDGWEGTMLPYAALVDSNNAADELLTYVQTVFKLSRPTLES